jgi:K+-transporting ATPase c subunit
MTKIMCFFILSELFTSRTYWIIVSRYHFNICHPTASGLNALASGNNHLQTTVWRRKKSEHITPVCCTKFFLPYYGIIAILFACIGTLFENLIQLVNIIGSIFYGTVLGIFQSWFTSKSNQSYIFISAVIESAYYFFIILLLRHSSPSRWRKLGCYG